METNNNKVILTGLQPTGQITLGNYLGAIKQMVEKQDEFSKQYIFIADLHAITLKHNPKELKENIRSLVATYLACGLDPNKNIIFMQSENPYHPSVSWLLECTAYFGETSRMIQFKEKSKKGENSTVGLFTYPILMAADILIYDVDYVPVGIDQKQHVELARDLSQRFNKMYGKTFKVPDVLINKEGTKIMDLLKPEIKMSKSNENQNGVIRLLDYPEIIRKKIMKSSTDSVAKVQFDPENQKGISNLINIYKSITKLEIEAIEKKFENSSYKEFKEEVANVVVNHLEQIQKRYYELLDSKELDEILDRGRDITLEIAKNKYDLMKKHMGLER